MLCFADVSTDGYTMIYDDFFWSINIIKAMTMTSTPITPSLRHTCPACGLLCDDIDPRKLELLSQTCTKAAAFYAREIPPTLPRIAGESASLNDAIKAAAALLKQSTAPVIAGSSTDVYGARALIDLANATHASLTHVNAESTLRNMRVLQQRGWQTTTLTEVRNRADVIVMIGTDVVSYNPRFFERVVWVPEAMFTQADARQIVYLGGHDLDTASGTSPDGRAAQVIACADADLPAVVAALRALVLGHPLSASAVGGVASTTLHALAETLKAASYATLVWVAKAFPQSHAELIIENVTETVVALNQKSRAMGLSLGGSDGDTSVNYAHTWRQGVIIDAPRWSQHDALIWVNSFCPQANLPTVAGPSIVLGAADSVFEQPPAVFIPVATPGLDGHGQQFRVDGSVTLPLSAAKVSQLPSLSAVVQQLLAALAAGEPS